MYFRLSYLLVLQLTISSPVWVRGWCLTSKHPIGTTRVARKQERRLESLLLSSSSSHDTSNDKDDNKDDDDLLYMGISQVLDELPPRESLFQNVAIGLDKTNNKPTQNRTIEIQKLSQRPPIFLLKGILSKDDCDYIINTAEEEGNYETAKTTLGGDDSQKRKKSQATWLSNYQHEGLSELSKTVQSIFLPFEPFYLDFVEEMQVVKYDTQGEYNLHHDGATRLLTVIYYINGVSETWFPLADFGRRVYSREKALREAGTNVDGKEQQSTGNDRKGVLVSSSSSSSPSSVKIERGDAIAFYNYFSDTSADWNAIHAGLPAESTKLIATHWYHHVPKGIRMGQNAEEFKRWAAPPTKESKA